MAEGAEHRDKLPALREKVEFEELNARLWEARVRRIEARERLNQIRPNRKDGYTR